MSYTVDTSLYTKEIAELAAAGFDAYITNKPKLSVSGDVAAWKDEVLYKKAMELTELTSEQVENVRKADALTASSTLLLAGMMHSHYLEEHPTLAAMKVQTKDCSGKVCFDASITTSHTTTRPTHNQDTGQIGVEQVTISNHPQLAMETTLDGVAATKALWVAANCN